MLPGTDSSDLVYGDLAAARKTLLQKDYDRPAGGMGPWLRDIYRHEFMRFGGDQRSWLVELLSAG
jgi:hypothetical protein